jgi:hypothetical protein
LARRDGLFLAEKNATRMDVPAAPSESSASIKTSQVLELGWF